MTNKEVIEAFLRGQRAANSTGSLSSTIDCLYSYSTCIAEYNKDGILYINGTKYSNTSSRHVTLLKRAMSCRNPKIVFNVERNSVHIVPKDERIYMY